MNIFKTIVLAGALSALALSGGCRKKTDTGMELANRPKHCYNGELDADELTIDFGGSCGTEVLGGSGVTMSSDCGQSTNSATVTSNFPTTNTYTVSSCTRTTSGSYYLYTLSLSGGGNIQMRTLTTVDFNTDLTVTSLPSETDECSVSFSAGSFSGSCAGGQVKIKYNGSSYGVNICNTYWYGGFYSGDIDAYATVN